MPETAYRPRLKPALGKAWRSLSLPEAAQPWSTSSLCILHTIILRILELRVMCHQMATSAPQVTCRRNGSRFVRSCEYISVPETTSSRLVLNLQLSRSVSSVQHVYT